MSVLTFKGGIHPFEGKNMSKSRAIKEILPKGEIVIPLSQHIGAPANAVVSVGDKVLCNQLIGEANGFVSANVHSSVSGTVKAIEPRTVTQGNKVLSVIIENDNEYLEIKNEDNRTLEELSKEDIIELIKKAGVVGMGGACFPTHVKLSPKNPEDIEYIIVNGSECEPYLTSDYRRMIEQPERLVEGLRIILKLFPNAKGIIAIEDNKLDAIVKFSELVKKDPLICVKTLYTKYPQGGERSLIYAVTGRKVNSSMLPADVGCIVDNVDTVYAIYNAVILKQPLTTRIVTVTGNAIKRPCNFCVKIGTNMEELIDAAGGYKKEPEKIVSGGPMMGVALYTLDIPIIKGSSALLCVTKDEVAAIETSACINCGRCQKACPSRIIPGLLAKHAEHNDKESFVKDNGMECCECGCCSYVCPSKLNLTQSIKVMRRNILADRKRK